ncbi:hypothetical protein PENTCL1PPCAC_10637, partial [Pristionchus entomophagus]
IGTKAEDKPPESLKNPEDVTAKNIFDPSDFVYSICKEDLNSFLSRTIYFGWAYTIAGTAVLITALFIDSFNQFRYSNNPRRSISADCCSLSSLSDPSSEIRV